MSLDISVNHGKHRLELNVTGFVDAGVLAESESAVRDGLAAILRTRTDFDLLVCVAASGPASSEAGEKLATLFPQLLMNRLRKAAHVDFTLLASMQIRRITDNDPRFQFFADRKEAEAWLDEE